MLLTSSICRYLPILSVYAQFSLVVSDCDTVNVLNQLYSHDVSDARVTFTVNDIVQYCVVSDCRRMCNLFWLTRDIDSTHTSSQMSFSFYFYNVAAVVSVLHAALSS